MSNLIIEKLLAKTQRTDIPAFRPGDTVRAGDTQTGRIETVCRSPPVPFYSGGNR